MKEDKEIKCEYCKETNKETRIIKSKKFNINLCNKHYVQMQIHGKILNKTRNDLNQIIIYENYAIVIIEKDNQIYHVKIDVEDINKIKNYKWHLNDGGYVVTTIDNKHIRMHKIIFDSLEDEVDHKNRDKLDNRKQNLRKVLHIDNSANCPIRINNTSGVIGVSFDKKNQKWRASITRNFKNINLGRFNDINNAIITRLQAEKEYFGEEFAPQRHLFKQYRI